MSAAFIVFSGGTKGQDSQANFDQQCYRSKPVEPATSACKITASLPDKLSLPMMDQLESKSADIITYCRSDMILLAWFNLERQLCAGSRSRGVN